MGGEELGKSSGYKDYVAGLLPGVATVVVGHPFDTVKVKLQKHNTEANGMKYRNGLHCTARILKTEGFGASVEGSVVDLSANWISLNMEPLLAMAVMSQNSGSYLQSKRANISPLLPWLVKGLYRGATSSFLGMAFESSLVFGIYSQTKQFLQGEVQSSKPQPGAIIPSAAFGGAIISFILCPTELVKCRMQVQGTDSLVSNSGRYSSPLDCAVKTIKSEGLRGIFRGGYTTLLRESMGNALFFTTYEYVRYNMHLRWKDISSCPNQLIDVGVGIMSGGLGGIAFWCVVLPFDVAKTIIQTSPEKNSTRNPFRILRSIYRRSGFRGCYTGLGPTVVRAFPANAAAIVTWEFAVKILGIKRD